jgi:hypothetical protein
MIITASINGNNTTAIKATENKWKSKFMYTIGGWLILIVVVLLIGIGLTLLGAGIGFVLIKAIPGIDKGDGIIAGVILAVGTIHFAVKFLSSKSDHIWELHEDEQVVVVDEPMFSSRKKKRNR